MYLCPSGMSVACAIFLHCHMFSAKPGLKVKLRNDQCVINGTMSWLRRHWLLVLLGQTANGVKHHFHMRCAITWREIGLVITGNHETSWHSLALARIRWYELELSSYLQLSSCNALSNATLIGPYLEISDRKKTQIGNFCDFLPRRGNSSQPIFCKFTGFVCSYSLVTIYIFKFGKIRFTNEEFITVISVSHFNGKLCTCARVLAGLSESASKCQRVELVQL